MLCNRDCEYVLVVVKSYYSGTISALLHSKPASARNLKAVFTFLFNLPYFIAESGSVDLQLLSRPCTF
jgi:hypothetical protein